MCCCVLHYSLFWVALRWSNVTWRPAASSCRSKCTAKVTAWAFFPVWSNAVCSLSLVRGGGIAHCLLWSWEILFLLKDWQLSWEALFYMRHEGEKKKKATYFEVGKTRALDLGAITAVITIISSRWYLQVLLVLWEDRKIESFFQNLLRPRTEIRTLNHLKDSFSSR